MSDAEKKTVDENNDFHDYLKSVFSEHIPVNVLSLAKAHTYKKKFNPGDTIVTQGQKAKSAFFIADGTLDIHYNNEHINQIEDNNIVGLLSIYDNDLIRSASIAAKTHCTLIEIDFEFFHYIEQHYPSVQCSLNIRYGTGSEHWVSDTVCPRAL